eukprot:12421527-Karenia_brevis.AAC.1
MAHHQASDGAISTEPALNGSGLTRPHPAKLLVQSPCLGSELSWEGSGPTVDGGAPGIRAERMR